ncbi:MAG: glucose 1-dehydrogenase [Hyphomicrobiaceae bacterium]
MSEAVAPEPPAASSRSSSGSEIRLDGQVALVTGASSGLGQATALGLGRAGARVIVNHPPTEDSRARAQQVVSAIEAEGGEAIALAADVSSEEQVDAMMSDAVRRFGTVHAVAANAGIERPAPIHEMSLADWRAVIDVNLTGAFLTARAAVREFLRRGPEPAVSAALGKIVFTSSVHEIIPWAEQANYCASKGGIAMLMRTLAQELAPRRIRVNSVAPGAIKTAINRAVWSTESSRERLLQLIPYGRVGEPDDIARAIVWLVSDASDYVNGTSLVVDGGMTLYPSFRDNG